MELASEDRQLVQITETVTGGEPHPLLDEVRALYHRSALAVDGFDDWTGSMSELAGTLVSTEDTDIELWVLVDHEQVRGILQLEFHLKDNPHLADGEMVTDPALDPAPLLDQLWPIARERLAVAGRTTLECYLDQDPADGDRFGTVSPDSGGEAARTPELQWYLANGFGVQQVDRRSTLQVSDAAPAGPVDPEYEVLTWTGVTPPELQAAMAPLRAAMSTDIPLGGSNRGVEIWDAGRVARTDQRLLELGRQQVWAAARHRSSNELVGHSFVQIIGSQPQAAFQEDTLVRQGHRGHRLGMALKQGVLAELGRSCPEVVRIHTWNADENHHMLAVNEALGFKVTALSPMVNWTIQGGHN